jgi:hypothetical protein
VVVDPFETAELRRVVLDAWAASPARFREDANAEEALAIGGYAGRVLVEIASNAADAARELGVPARIRVRLTGDELRVANTGSALTAAGVAALASLRASAKRDTHDSVGHFGVGFTAVLSWSRAPRVVSTTGGIRFDEVATAAEIGSLRAPALDREVANRAGQVPVLRLPWPTAGDEEPVPEGFATEVRLPMTTSAAAEVARMLADDGTAEDLFWALPDLAEIDLPDRIVRCGIDQDGCTVIADEGSIRRYRTADRSGGIPPALLADRPIEERLRAHWRITWALPVDADPTADELSRAAQALTGASRRAVPPTTIGAPTPTDEPLTLPARLVGTFPVDDTRRRLAPGPLCDYLLERAADTYIDLIAETVPGDRWELLPAGGFPAGPIDAALRDAVLGRIATTPLLRSAVGDHVTPGDACLLPGVGADGTALFGQAIPGLLPPVSRAAATVLRGLGVVTLTWSQASAALAGIDRDPAFWWQVYEAIGAAEQPPDPEDLADIPIPLTGGRRVLGARGCLLPGTADGPGSAGSADRIAPELARRAGQVVPALRIVDPAAAHPLLERLGARSADADSLLADPGLAAEIDRIRGDLEDDDPDPDELDDLASVVLDLLAAGGRAGRAGPAHDFAAGGDASGAGPALLGELVLTDTDGQAWPAGELLIPGAPLAALLAADVDRPVIGDEWTDRYPVEVLVAAGVRSGFVVLTVADPPGAEVTLPDLDDWFDWLDRRGGGRAGGFTALADLDLIDPDRWPAALELIGRDRDARAALMPTASGLSYSGWWLSRHAVIDGRAPVDWRLPDAEDLIGLYEPLPIALDPVLARSIGVRADLTTAAADRPEDLLDRLADPARRVPPGRVAAITAVVVAELDRISRSGDDIDLPAGVRTITGDVVDADHACVLDVPWLAQVMPVTRLVPGAGDPALVGRVLDLPMASEVVRTSVVAGAGTPSPEWSAQVRGRVERSAAAVGLRLADVEMIVATELTVVVDDGDPVSVQWWARGDRFWVDGSAQACGRAAAWAAGSWSGRHRAIAAAGEDWMALAEDSL